MVKPFVACLILTGIHAYLGLHVIERGVVFVDLALAQIAAFGATLGFLWGFGLHSTASYLIALVFTLLGAAIFSATRLRHPVVPQEAFIGIVYAVAAAASILILSRAPEGGEELKALLIGHLLFVEWPEVLKMLLLYSGIGFIHWLVRKPLLLISQNPEAAFRQGLRVRLWDFLFYATFGFVVTSSVEMAGVLLVFSFLIVPAVCGALLVQTIGQRLFVGWVVGVLTSIAGLLASYVWDLPTGATVVCAFGLCLLICACLRLLIPGTRT
ncbi:MAG: metal ABC transporter permease [Candidatus Omnitrophica bacterium]|nr:metal ABC transporter permease [Candidatus Omnitrophota bacterium]MBI2174588.1 metal ABC transporter permease [Candidatus Omnitrophota bacterium]